MNANVRRCLKSALYGLMPRSLLLARGPRHRRRVALTFDDGPDERTNDYLGVLESLCVRATFFLIGEECEKDPSLVREYVRRGHQIAGHGWDHTRFSALSGSVLREQIDRTNEALGPQTTARPWVRPPHGDLDARALVHLLASGSTIAMWSLDSKDYEVSDAGALASRCAPDRVRPGEVILLHEGQSWTLEALPRIVVGLRRAGFEMVTMAELFEP